LYAEETEEKLIHENLSTIKREALLVGVQRHKSKNILVEEIRQSKSEEQRSL